MIAVHRVLDSGAGIQVPPGLCALGVMTKAPRAGEVKTRLSPPLTPEEAASLNVCFLRDTTTAITGCVSNGGARGIGVYTPVGAENAWAEILPAHFQLVPQRGDAFGERLIAAGEDLLALGFDSFCLIDSDSPTVPQRAYTEAVKRLAQSGDRMVLGPSDDGGYYLIGLKKMHRPLFERIDWSTERVAEQTIARAKEIGLAVDLLPTWYDVDDRATLGRLCNELLGGTGTVNGYPAPETHAFLARLIAAEGRQRIWPV
ncbi:MAG: TIGR04282 family arsenosugar biosynthesis glycosyltransferase [Chthoniobacterales bacterium]